MKQRTTLTLTLLLAGIAVVAVAGMMLTAGGATAQTDADQQATIDALVNQRFTETAMAQPTVDATAAFQQTVDAAFMLALTASAQPAGQIAATQPALPEGGGVQVVLTAARELSAEETTQAAEVMTRRLELYGVSNPVVSILSPGRIAVIFGGEDNPERVITLISREGLVQLLEFKGLDRDNPARDPGELLRTDAHPDAEGRLNSDTDEPFVTIADSGDVTEAEAQEGDDDEWTVRYVLRDEAVDRINSYIDDDDSEPVGITLDGEMLTVVELNRGRNHREGRIASDFSRRRAEELAVLLNSGTLPVNFVVESASAAAVPPTPTPTASPTITPTFTPSPSPTFDPFPTTTAGQVPIAEQVFEHGRMMWVQPVSQIWVMVADPDDSSKGEWQVFEDTFQDGEAEFDPAIVPPTGLYQPERGFGKLWRENDEVREALGWGVTPEFGYVSRYEYHPGGEVDSNLTYTPAPGFHVLFALDGTAFRFNEDDGTWETLEADDSEEETPEDS